MTKFEIVDLSNHDVTITEEQLREATLSAMLTCLEDGEIEMPYSVRNLDRFIGPDGMLLDHEGLRMADRKAHLSNFLAFRSIIVRAFRSVGFKVEEGQENTST